MLPSIHRILRPRPRKYRNLVKHLSPVLLTKDADNLSFTQADLFTDLSSSRGTTRLLGYYSERGIQFGLSRFGVFDLLEKQGLSDGNVRINTDKPYKHSVKIIHSIQNKSYLSTEVVLRHGSFTLPQGEQKIPHLLDFLIVEWLLMQNPLRSFTSRRPQLPGQEYPGLGIGNITYEILYWVARRMKADGVLVIPNHLHTGIFYGRQFLFLDPVKQGYLYKIGKLSSKNSLFQLSWACAEGQLIDVNETRVFLWEPAPMVLPVSRRMRDYFHSPDYVKTVGPAQAQLQVRIHEGYMKGHTKDWKAC